MKRSIWLKGALVLASLTVTSAAMAADHLDGPAASADPSTDITDIYSWTDATTVKLVLNVAPIATNMSKFSDKAAYVFHTQSHAAFGMPGTKLDIICTFDVVQRASCWIGDKDYVTGDASVVAGIQSDSKKVRLFAGLRDDPFFFNLDGFKDTATTVIMAAPTLMFDTSGCPTLDMATSNALVNKLKTDPKSMPVPGGPAKDFFAGLNVLSIVLEIDKALLSGGGPIMSVWASTNKVGS
jgi:hypothetical protein